MHPKYIRNFCIIAHIDHGKSTLADGLLKVTGALSSREEKAQFLDNMDLERERGITIKAQTVRLKYKNSSDQEYQLNLIDTPGHVDFSYEVSRSLAACEGALLVVDAVQGVEAQTLANVYLAIENGLEIQPVINKIDLPSADVKGVKNQIKEVIGLDVQNTILASAKQCRGMDQILEAVVQNFPPPQALRDQPLRALVFDSWFDSYQGVIVLCRVVDGCVHKGDCVQFMSTGKNYEVLKLGVFSPFVEYLSQIEAGEVGFLICGIKNIKDVKVGDTVTHVKGPRFQAAKTSLKGFKEIKPMVFSGLFPVDTSCFEHLKKALNKLALNDSSLSFEPERSQALGFGMRCGFLGLLHMEIVQERLEREFNLDLITTAPSVVHKVYLKNGSLKNIENPSDMPDPVSIEKIEEPMVYLVVHTPSEYIGGVLKLCENRRGRQIKLEYAMDKKVIIEYELPLNEIVMDFYDKLKSITRGYGSMEYELMQYEASQLVKMDVLLNGDKVDALSLIIHKSKAEVLGRQLAKKLKEVIPRQQYKVAVQAAIGAKIIARETLGALRKDVTAKCYGGDVSRKRKLLEKQKKGKKRMKQIGRIDVPQEAFLAVLGSSEDS